MAKIEQEPELLKITKEMREALRAPFPDEAIKQHESKKYLSTIKQIYITERLNDVFGIGRWNLIHTIIDKTENYIVMEGEFISLDYDCQVPKQYGGHKLTGSGTEPVDGYKSAVTDCISKIASFLEIGLDVFKGKVKAGKGNNSQKSPYQQQKAAQKPPATPLSNTSTKSANPSQILFVLFNELKLTEVTQDKYKLYCYHKYGVTGMNQLTPEQITEQKTSLKEIAKKVEWKKEFSELLIKVNGSGSVPDQKDQSKAETIRTQIKQIMSQIYGKNKHMIDDKISAMTMDGTHDLDSMAVNELKGVLDCVKISWDEFQETLKNNMAKSAF